MFCIPETPNLVFICLTFAECMYLGVSLWNTEKSIDKAFLCLVELHAVQKERCMQGNNRADVPRVC